MVKVIGVRFRQAGKIYNFDPLDFKIEVGNHVIVETARGIEYGKVVQSVKEKNEEDVIMECRAMNGIQLQEDCLLFLDVDPNLTVCSTVPFAAGMKFAVTYHYYPLGRFQHEQPGKALLSALNTIKLHAEAEKNDVLEQLQAALAENTRLNNQLTELQNSRAAYEDSLENLYESSSWRLTAPLRALRRLLRG